MFVCVFVPETVFDLLKSGLRLIASLLIPWVSCVALVMSTKQDYAPSGSPDIAKLAVLVDMLMAKRNYELTHWRARRMKVAHQLRQSVRYLPCSTLFRLARVLSTDFPIEQGSILDS